MPRGVALCYRGGILDEQRRHRAARRPGAIVPLLCGFVGRSVLGLDPVILLGALTGALTSTPALDLVNRQADSPLPTVGYAGTYAFANVLLAIAARIRSP